jgi:hypothetical protein
MRRVLAGLIVLLSAASAAAVDSHLFYLQVSNPNSCLLVEFTAGGRTYSLQNTSGTEVAGPTPREFSEGEMVPASLKWYQHTLPGGGSCESPTAVLCSGQFALTAGSGTVCTYPTGLSPYTLTYQVTQVDEGGKTFWSIILRVPQ